MDYAYEIRRQAEAAPRAALPAVASAMWKAFGEGHLSEAEAEALSGLIELRSIAPTPAARPGKAVGSRPRTDASMERRRRWAASGRLPPGLAARFTLAEQAALAVVAVEVAKRGDCRLAVGQIAAMAGVSETMVRNAIREARNARLPHRRGTPPRPLPQRHQRGLHRVAGMECLAATSPDLASTVQRRVNQGGGCRSPQGTNTPVSHPMNSEGRKPKKGCRRTVGDLAARAHSGYGARAVNCVA